MCRIRFVQAPCSMVRNFLLFGVRAKARKGGREGGRGQRYSGARSLARSSRPREPQEEDGRKKRERERETYTIPKLTATLTKWKALFWSTPKS